MQPTLTVCIHRRVNPETPSCGARGGEEIATALQRQVEVEGLPLNVNTFPCLGYCAFGPNIKVSPGGEIFHGVTADTLPAVIEAALALAPACSDK